MQFLASTRYLLLARQNLINIFRIFIRFVSRKMFSYETSSWLVLENNLNFDFRRGRKLSRDDERMLVAFQVELSSVK